jgi:hypothetical protein
MLPPLPRHSDWRHCFAQSTQSYQTSPPRLAGRPAHFTFRGLLGVHSRCGLHTRAATVCRGTLNRRLQPFRYLHSCSGCFRLERLPGGVCTHWKAPPFHGARRECEEDGGLERRPGHPAMELLPGSTEDARCAGRTANERAYFAATRDSAPIGAVRPGRREPILRYASQRRPIVPCDRDGHRP